MGDALRRVRARTIAIFFLEIIVRSSAVNVRLLPEYVWQRRPHNFSGTTPMNAPERKKEWRTISSG